MGSKKGWIGVDLDGTLAHYEGWIGPHHIGAPIPAMVQRVKGWLAEGREVRVFTARAYPGFPGDEARRQESVDAIIAIRVWTKEHIGQELHVTCTKDFDMVQLWDDRAVQVLTNTGLSLQILS